MGPVGRPTLDRRSRAAAEAVRRAVRVKRVGQGDARAQAGRCAGHGNPGQHEYRERGRYKAAWSDRRIVSRGETPKARKWCRQNRQCATRIAALHRPNTNGDQYQCHASANDESPGRFVTGKPLMAGRSSSSCHDLSLNPFFSAYAVDQSVKHLA